MNKVEGEIHDLAVKVDNFFESKQAHIWIAILVLIAAVIQGLETVPVIKETYEFELALVGYSILVTFIIEMSARIYITRSLFFKNYWNVFDLLVIVASCTPASFGLSILRILRMLNTLNILAIFPKTKHITDGLACLMPRLLTVIMVVAIFFYTFSIMAISFFGKDFPGKFGSIGKAMYSLFDILSTWKWAVTSEALSATHPHAWVFFLSFTLIFGYVLMNLIVGSIVGAMIEAAEEDDRKKGRHQVHNALREIHADIKELKKLMGKDQKGAKAQK